MTELRLIAVSDDVKDFVTVWVKDVQNLTG